MSAETLPRRDAGTSGDPGMVLGTGIVVLERPTRVTRAAGQAGVRSAGGGAGPETRITGASLSSRRRERGNGERQNA